MPFLVAFFWWVHVARSGQPAVGRSCVKLVKAAIAYWHSIRGMSPVFDGQWNTKLRAFWASLKKACSHVPQEKESLLLVEMEFVLEPPAAGESVPREAV